MQIGFFPIVSNPDCAANPQPDGCGTHSILIRAVINFFSYLALSLDVLGALFALLTARSLLLVSNDIQDLLDDKYILDGYIVGQLDDPDGELLHTLSIESGRIVNDMRMQQGNAGRRTKGQHGAISFILLGMLCLFLALLVEVIQSQPLKFWIPFVVLVATMSFVLGGNEIQHYPGMMSGMISRVNVWLGRTRKLDLESGGQAIYIYERTKSLICLRRSEYSFPTIPVE